MFARNEESYLDWQGNKYSRAVQNWTNILIDQEDAIVLDLSLGGQLMTTRFGSTENTVMVMQEISQIYVALIDTNIVNVVTKVISLRFQKKLVAEYLDQQRILKIIFLIEVKKKSSSKSGGGWQR